MKGISDMQTESESKTASVGTKILINRNKFRNNTIYINPRILKSASKELIPPNMESVNVSRVSPDIGEQCKQQFPNVPRPSSNDTNATVASKCVYLNPHFQRLLPNSVHINPKKFSEVIQSSNKSLLNTQTCLSKQNDVILNSVKPASEKTVLSLPSKANIGESQSESNHTNSTSNYSCLASSKKWENSAKERVISSKLGNNLAVKKPGYSNKLIKISDTKLIRIPDRNKSWTVNRALQKSHVNQMNQLLKKPRNVQDNKFVKRKSEKQKITHAVLQKTALSPLSVKQRLTNTVENKGSPSKYKIDRRSIKSRLLRNYKKIAHRRESAVVITHRRNLVLRRSNVSPTLCKNNRHSSALRSVRSNERVKILLSSRKLLRIGSSVKTKEMKGKEESSSQTTRLVRIGGVLYRTSRNKLTKSRTPETSTKPSIVKRLKMERSRIIYVRGNKFIMDAKGKTLKQVSQKAANNCEQNSKVSPIKRIDIGGVTFIKKSPDLLVRTNSHTARNIVNHAKNKSIAMLTNKLRKINQPCPFYRKFGKCPRREKGTCQLVHDPKQVSVCKRFLQGECNIVNCLLSHQIVPEKMPTCKYFLEGCCIREECPYLHVKLNSKAVICEKFLQGFCAEGSRCKKRHSHICPDFEKFGTCQKGKYCPYPHKTGVKHDKKLISNQAVEAKSSSPHGDQQRKRYYQEETNEEVISRTVETENLKRHKLPEAEQDSGNCSSSQESEQQTDTHIKRPRIGRLPSYIALGH